MDVYSNVKFERIGKRTRITATRYSTLKKYRALHELIVGNPDWCRVEDPAGDR